MHTIQQAAKKVPCSICMSEIRIIAIPNIGDRIICDSGHAHEITSVQQDKQGDKIAYILLRN